MNKPSKATQADLDSAIADLSQSVRDSGLSAEEVSMVIFKASVREMVARHGPIDAEILLVGDLDMDDTP